MKRYNCVIREGHSISADTFGDYLVLSVNNGPSLTEIYFDGATLEELYDSLSLIKDSGVLVRHSDIRFGKFILQTHRDFVGWIMNKGIVIGDTVHCKRLYHDFMDDNLTFRSGEVNKISSVKFKRWVESFSFYYFGFIPFRESGDQGMVYVFKVDDNNLDK
jgi:hypothetical protein